MNRATSGASHSGTAAIGVEGVRTVLNDTDPVLPELSAAVDDLRSRRRLG